MITRHVLGLLLVLVSLVVQAAALPVDVVVLIDDSGSMKVGAERRPPVVELESALDALRQALPPGSRLAAVAFSETPTLLRPLDAAPVDNIATMRFAGAWTDVPAAVERGLYELRTLGRPEALQAVVLISDGRIDLPRTEQEADAERWLFDSLLLDARDAAVVIVAMVPSGADADFRLLQRLTRETGGRYALMGVEGPAAAGESLGRALTAVAASRAAAPAPASSTPTAAPPAVAAQGDPMPAAPAASSPTASTTSMAPGAAGPAAAPGDAPSSIERRMPIAIALAAAVAGAFLAGAIAAIVLDRRGRAAATRLPEPTWFPECSLLDRERITGAERIPLKGRLNLVTRLSEVPEPGVHMIRIPERHVGRRHAMLEWRDSAFWVRDLKSVNGTFVNDARITEPVQLRHGDRVRFHDFEFEFSDRKLEQSNNTEFGTR